MNHHCNPPKPRKKTTISRNQVTVANAREQVVSNNRHGGKSDDKSALERSKLVAEWVELTNQSAQVEQVESKRAEGRGHRPKGGDAEASRQLGLSRGDIHRSKKIANLSPEAQQAESQTTKAPITRTRPRRAAAMTTFLPDQTPQTGQTAGPE